MKNMDISSIDTAITKDNINNVIAKYKELLKDFPLTIHSSHILELLQSLKRENIGKGPYPNVSMFEAINRIMTDLVILCGVKELLDKGLEGIKFNTINVEYGHNNKQLHDIMAHENEITLHGEAFNVSRSLFQIKKRTSLNKLRKNIKGNTKLIIIFNKDALNDSYLLKQKYDEYLLPVDISMLFKEEQYD